LCVGLCRAITDPGANNGCGWRVFRITWSPPWRRGMRGQPTTHGDSTNNHYNYRWWVFFSVGLVILAAIWWDNTGFLDLWWSSKHTVSEWISATGSATRWLGQRSWMTWLVDDPVVIYWIFTLWLCQNSYWKWWFSIAMLVYQRVTMVVRIFIGLLSMTTWRYHWPMMIDDCRVYTNQYIGEYHNPLGVSLFTSQWLCKETTEGFEF
jgi:hypothetical protein